MNVCRVERHIKTRHVFFRDDVKILKTRCSGPREYSGRYRVNKAKELFSVCRNLVELGHAIADFVDNKYIDCLAWVDCKARRQYA